MGEQNYHRGRSKYSQRWQMNLEVKTLVKGRSSGGGGGRRGRQIKKFGLGGRGKRSNIKLP